MLAGAFGAVGGRMWPYVGQRRVCIFKYIHRLVCSKRNHPMFLPMNLHHLRTVNDRREPAIQVKHFVFLAIGLVLATAYSFLFASAYYQN